MSQSHRKTSGEPLLGSSSKLYSDPSLHDLSLTTRTTIKVLSIIRIATGAACLVVPRFTCDIFKYNVPAEHALLVRMFGARDAVLGELLMTAENEKVGNRRQVDQESWRRLTNPVKGDQESAVGRHCD